MPTHLDSIRAYYDQNTPLFLAFNRSRQAENIHRSLWTNDATTLEEAQNVVNEYILKEIEAVAPTLARIADLGCGVGAGLTYIGPRLTEPESVLGLTLSPLQARLANQFARSAGLDRAIRFLEGDFNAVPLASESLDVVYSVEAVVHAPNPEQYFREASRLLRTRGRLILVDDYRANRQLSDSETKWLHTYINGWHVPGVITVPQACTFAEKYHLQLVRDDELTPFLQLRNLPNSAASMLLFIGSRLPIRHAILPSMLGSLALQQCLYMKIIEYRFLVFEKI